MQRSKLVSIIFVFSAAAVLVSGLFQEVSADRYSSSNYVIDASAGNSVGGSNSSTNYKLVGSGGESVIGNGSGGSYKLGMGYVAQLQQSLQLTVQPGGQVAYWPLDEDTGTVGWDMSANANHAQLIQSPASVAGKVSNARDFNGTNQYASVANNSSLNFTTAFTIEAWVKPGSTAVSTNYNIVAKSDVGTKQGYRLLLSGWGTTNRPELTVGNGTTESIATAVSTVTNTSVWTHVVATYAAGTVKFYINGVLDNTVGGVVSSVTNTSGILAIGAHNTVQEFADAGIDEVKLFNRTLTDKEVKAEYDAGSAGNAAGLSLNTILAGASQTANVDAVVQTDAPDYTLSVNQNNNLTSGANTIPAVSGSIASPVTWVEGTTKGLGFTLYGTTATAIPGKWSSGAAYAAFPGSSTSFYDRNNFTTGAKDVLNMRVRADVISSQAMGDYTNVVTWTGTMIP